MTSQTHPLDPPFDTASKPPSASMFASLPDANDGAHPGTTQPPRRGSRQRVRDIDAIAKQLSERDWKILRSVAEHGFLTVGQIEVLHFGDNAEINRPRVARLTCARLRKLRVLASLPQRVGGAQRGSTALIHHVDEVGERLLRADSTSGRRRFHEPTTRFLDHRLGIAEVRVALVDADRLDQLELLRCDIEPTAWRDYVGIGGARLTLKPDLYAETATPPGSEYVDAAFIEVDKGTESIPTILRKCHEYEAYRRQGIEQERSEGIFPHVVWSMGGEPPDKAVRRHTALRQAIDRDRKLQTDLFQIIAPEDLVTLMQQIGGEK